MHHATGCGTMSFFSLPMCVRSELCYQSTSIQLPYWVMKLICWCNICNGNDILRLGEWISACARSALCPSVYILKWPQMTSRGASWLHWWTRPSQSSGFMRRYQSNPSWVCVWSVTETSNSNVPGICWTI